MARAASSSRGRPRLRAAADTQRYKSKPPGHPADTGHLQTGPVAIENSIAADRGRSTWRRTARSDSTRSACERVAVDPTSGFHFDAGLRYAVKVLGYPREEIEALPASDASVGYLISTGVVDLAPDKPRVQWRETFVAHDIDPTCAPA